MCQGCISAHGASMCRGCSSSSAYPGSTRSEPAHSFLFHEYYSYDSTKEFVLPFCSSPLPNLIAALQHLLDSPPQLPFLHELSESSLSPHFPVTPRVRRHWGRSFPWLFLHLISYTHKILRQEEISAQLTHITDKETEIWRT